jgi:rare lipoprotein A (peptidoglycan hydrolase)
MSSFLKSDDHAQAEPASESEAAEPAHGPGGASLSAAGHSALGRILQSGYASYYGTSDKAHRDPKKGLDGFVGQKQANGTPLDPKAMTVAHKTLPLGTKLTVLETKTQKTADVTVTDRGPYEPGRIIDGTVAVAEELGYKDAGFGPVELFKKE